MEKNRVATLTLNDGRSVELPIMSGTLGVDVLDLHNLAKLGMFPFFGVLLTGLPGTLALLLMAGVWFWLGVRWYRQDIMAWWTLLALMILLSVSNGITFARVNIIEVYQKLGYSQAQLDLMQKQDWMGNSFMVWGCLLWLVPMVGYVIWTRRYFPTRSA